MWTKFISLFGWRTKLTIWLLTAAVAFGGGWKVGYDLSEIGHLKKAQYDLMLKLQKAEAALVADAEAAKVAAEEFEKLNEIADELRTKIEDGKCFTPSESDELRNLWDRKKRSSSRTR